jgi:hypothetical protein
MMENPTVCCIKGCEKPVTALGLCVNHWRRNRRYGSPVALMSHSGQFRGLSAEERFFKQVRKTDGCWLWMGGRDKNGYGIFKGVVAGELFLRAHRFSYALHTGDLLIGRQAMHSCDNPCCVNPDHLSSGTAADNTKDMIAKGRHNAPRGEDASRAVLTEPQALSIMKDARPHSQLAAEFGVTIGTISDIKRRYSWKHLEGEIVKSERIGNRGEKSYAAKITEQDVLAIRSSTQSGKELAARYGVSPQTVTDIRKFRSWKHLS